jgi:alkanesulfonate monooxygenase SsuD/methylene tetrahydromethanopterin reductase-like flavin-dependent oxidoreductase (luciferase family)
LRYGLYLPNFGAFGSARFLAELARNAEDAGWDGLFIWDHVARDFTTDIVDPWVALAAMAIETRALVIGALVTPLARRRPWIVARETVSLDHLSGGRLVFGAGLGSGRDSEWGSLGELTEPRLRAQRLDEGLEIVNGLWSGAPFAFSGEHYQLEESTFLPRPVQSPRIPVWIGGYWPNRAPFRRAARWDGCFPLFNAEGDDALVELAECVRFVNTLRSDDGPYDFAHLSPPTFSQNPDTSAERAGATWWLERMTPDAFGAEWTGPWPVATMRAHIAAGPPGKR